MTDLTKLSAATLSGLLADRSVSSVEATQAHLDHIAAVDTDVHAFLHIAGVSALATAADVDARRAAGERMGPLAGVPIAIKDVLATKDMPSTAGSKILEGWIPPYDATVVRKLREAGGVIQRSRPPCYVRAPRWGTSSHRVDVRSLHEWADEQGVLPVWGEAARRGCLLPPGWDSGGER